MAGTEGDFTPERLKQYDGKNGRHAYVACKGKVYDVTDSYLWSDGRHFGEHEAGTDLTDQLDSSPHGDDVFEGFEVVGRLVPSKS